jgi:hypothetical protein
MKTMFLVMLLWVLITVCIAEHPGSNEEKNKKKKKPHHHSKSPTYQNVITGVPTAITSIPTLQPSTEKPTRKPITKKPTSTQPATPPELQWPSERKQTLIDQMQNHAAQEGVLSLPYLCWDSQESRAFCLGSVQSPPFKPVHCVPSFVCPGRIFTLEMARAVVYNLQWYYIMNGYVWTGLPSEIKGNNRIQLSILIANFLLLCPSDPLAACDVWDEIIVPTIRTYTKDISNDENYIFPNGTVIPAYLRPSVFVNNTVEQVPLQMIRVSWIEWDSKFGTQAERLWQQSSLIRNNSVNIEFLSSYNIYKSLNRDFVQYWNNGDFIYPYVGQASITQGVMESFFQVFEEDE